VDSDEAAMAVWNCGSVTSFKARISLSTVRLEGTFTIIRSVLVDEQKHIFPKDIMMSCKSV